MKLTTEEFDLQFNKPATTIRPDERDNGMWHIIVQHKGHTWSRHAWSMERAEQIANDLQRIAIATGV